MANVKISDLPSAGPMTGAELIEVKQSLGSFSYQPSAVGWSLLAAANAAALRGVLGLGDSSTKSVGTTAGTVAAGDHTHTSLYQPLDADLTAIAGLTSAADKGIQFTGAGTAATYDLTAAGKALLDDANAAAQRVTLGVRDVLSAARTYYVRTDGSDSNDGLANTAGRAFLTIQKGVDAAMALDNNGYDVTIQVADGTYAGVVTLKSFAGSGRITILGNTTTPANVLISTTASCVSGTNITGTYLIDGVKLTTTSGSLVTLLGSSTYVELGRNVYGTCTIRHITVNLGATVDVVNDYTIDGGCQTHLYSQSGIIRDNSHTITITGTPAFSSAFIVSTGGGALVLFTTNTISGSCTGNRFSVNSVASANFAGTTIPGNALGAAGGGGEPYSGTLSGQIPTTGGTITVAAGVTTLLLNPAGTLATLTINLATLPYDDQTFTLSSTQAITALTMAPSAGHTLKAGLTTIAANGYASWKFQRSDLTWYRIG